MITRTYKPYTAEIHSQTISHFDSLTSSKPTRRHLLVGHKRAKGRNQRGIITCRHRGGGHKRLYRYLDFRRQYRNVWGTVIGIEYDPNRNVHICLVRYPDGTETYIVQPRGLQINDLIIASDKAPIELGNALPLSAV